MSDLLENQVILLNNSNSKNHKKPKTRHYERGNKCTKAFSNFKLHD